MPKFYALQPVVGLVAPLHLELVELVLVERLILGRKLGNAPGFVSVVVVHMAVLRCLLMQ